ncbi:MAG: hypothetical protein GXY74_08095 [Phycisphaerae bacterium]|nr:hypothetical protein [Phycisphaerae bacterium]
MRSVRLQLVVTFVATAFTGLTMLLPAAISCDDDIREDAIRFWTSGERPQGTYFVCIDGDDPDEEFLSRFSDLHWKAKPASLVRQRGNKFRWEFYDPETDESSTILTVSDVAWAGPCYARLNFSFMSASLGGGGVVMHLVWSGGHWRVVGMRRTFMI